MMGELCDPHDYPYAVEFLFTSASILCSFKPSSPNNIVSFSFGNKVYSLNIYSTKVLHEVKIGLHA